MSKPRFHLAFPVNDIETTRAFYVECLGAKVGREDTRWIDFDFWGHQLSAHLAEASDPIPTNAVDGEQVPCRHFGVILSLKDWTTLETDYGNMGSIFSSSHRCGLKGNPANRPPCFSSTQVAMPWSSRPLPRMPKYSRANCLVAISRKRGPAHSSEPLWSPIRY